MRRKKKKKKKKEKEKNNYQMIINTHFVVRGLIYKHIEEELEEEFHI